MKKHRIYMLIASVLIAVLCLSSCTMGNMFLFHVIPFEESFQMNISTDTLEQEKLSFAHFSNVLIIPEIKDYGHDQHCVYICAWSKGEEESFQVESVKIMYEDKVFFQMDAADSDAVVTLNQQENGMFFGYITAGYFDNDDIPIKHKTLITMKITVSRGEETKNIDYDIEIKEYHRAILPT